METARVYRDVDNFTIPSQSARSNPLLSMIVHAQAYANDPDNPATGSAQLSLVQTFGVEETFVDKYTMCVMCVGGCRANYLSWGERQVCHVCLLPARSPPS